MSSIQSNIRKIALVCVITFDILMLIFWWMAEQYVFFWVFVGINVCVIAGEILNNFFVYGKTLSTQVTKFLEQGRHRVLIYLALAFLGLSIASLIIHLAVW